MSYLVRNAVRAKAHTADTPRWQIDRDAERGECFARESHNAAGGRGFCTVEVLQAFCEVNNRQIQWADEYGEPGYGPAEKGILFADWNDIPKSLKTRLEAQGYELEWKDEWYIDCDNSPSKAWRTEPDGHGWECRLRAMDGYYITPDSDPQEWIDSALDEESRALPSWFDESELTRRGYAPIDQDDKEVVFHPGQNETPDKFMPALLAEGYSVVLQCTDRGQFDVHYRIWTRKEADENDAGAEFCEFDNTYYTHKS